jgi:primosomal protein N'
MYVVEVLPISRGIFKDRLSYFTANKDVTLGSLVSVPVRNRKVLAIVTSCKDVREEKASLKQESFSLRKIENLKGKPFLSEAFLGAVEDTAQFFAGSIGTVLSTFIPKAVLDSPQGLCRPPVEEKHSEKKMRETLVLQGSDEERFGEYRSLIRERFARGLSVFLCFPTTHEVEGLLLSLERGIRDYSFILHGGLPRAKIVSNWKAALASEHPVLIVGTGTFLSIPRHDLGTIIIERESSRFYKSGTRPFPDVRIFAEYLARRSGLELILGDTALRIETLYKVEAGAYAEYGGSLKFRLLWSGAYKIVDMRAKSDGTSLSKFEILCSDIKNVITGLKEKSEKLFLFTSRRGLAPLTFCGDCQTVVTCRRCTAPITLHRSGASRTFFLCHHCGDKRSTEERCRVCNSWKLQTLGIGIESVEEALRKEFPDVSLYRLDKDTAETNKKALEIADEFYASKNAILLGTEVALYYLRSAVENAGVVSIDSLFSLPDFRINERIFHMLLSLRAKTEKRLIIQTRNTEATVLGFAATGSINDFYKEEVEIREKFGYPPFSTLIKISIEGSDEQIEKEAENLQNYLEGEELEIFPAFIASVKGRSIVNGLLKIKNGGWPSPDLSARLAALPPHFKVQVDPESII